jgi:hypothetical protein
LTLGQISDPRAVGLGLAAAMAEELDLNILVNGQPVLAMMVGMSLVLAPNFLIERISDVILFGVM